MAKKIIICFDGTSNDPKDAEQEVYEHGGVEDDGISNVLKLYFLLGGRIENINQSKDEMDDGEADPLLPSIFSDQPCFYFQGVGSYGGPLRKLFNAGLSPRLLDVRRIINMGIDTLKHTYESGDEIYLFGFSRGSAIARRFASVITDEKHKLNIDAKAIRFMGLFDTVASFGIPIIAGKKKPDSEVIFENANHVSDNVREALHLLSLDEQRTAFRPTLMADEKRITEVWFPGVHSDVGGGYYYDGLSDITLKYMLGELGRRKLGLQTRSPEDVITEEFDNNDYGLDRNDIEIIPNHLSKLHWHKRVADIFIKDRDLRVCASKNHGAVKQSPLVHHSAVDLIADSHDYTTASFVEGMPHQIVKANGELSGEAKMKLSNYQKKHQSRVHPLGLDENKTVQIHAAQFYCPTCIHVSEGEKYIFTHDPETQWVDKTIKCDAEGWKIKDKTSLLKGVFFKIAENFRRNDEAKWFELLGSIGQEDSTCFRATQHAGDPYKIPQSGELFMFPNDLAKTYDNNRGFIEVTIKRVA